MGRIAIVFAIAALVGCAEDGSATRSASAAPALEDSAGAAKPVAKKNAPKVQPSRTLKRTEPLPELARDLLRSTMVRHGENMENLLWATLMLDYESTETLAGWIGSRPRLARAVPGQEDTINAALPEQFFAFQDDLQASARALSKAAAARDDAGMASAYARMTATCVSCHSLYLRLPPK